MHVVAQDNALNDDLPAEAVLGDKGYVALALVDQVTAKGSLAAPQGEPKNAVED